MLAGLVPVTLPTPQSMIAGAPNIPNPPALGNVDPNKVDEIRRTVYVGNLDVRVTPEQLLAFFGVCGEILFCRVAGEDAQPTRFAFIEFADLPSVNAALSLNGHDVARRPRKINHCKNAIVEPERLV
eukprot:Colp12_sorted_trinity150504_noHs@5210